MGIDVSGYARGMLTAQTLTETFGSTFTAFVTNPVLGGVQVLKKLGASAIKTAGQVLSMAESNQRLADQTGVAVDTIQALSRQNELAGFSAEIAERFIRNFTTRLGQAERGATMLQVALADVGVELGTDVNTAFETAVRTLSNMEDAQIRNALAAQLFGEEAGPLVIQTLREFGGDVSKIVDKMTKLGVVTDRLATDQLAGLNTTVGTAKLGFEGLKQTAVREFLLGFSDNTKLTDESMIRLVGTLRNELIPVFRDAGDSVRGFVDSFAGLRNNDFIEGLKLIFGIIEPLREGTVSLLGSSTGTVVGSIAAGQTPDTIRSPLSSGEIDRARRQAEARRARVRAGQ